MFGCSWTQNQVQDKQHVSLYPLLASSRGIKNEALIDVQIIQGNLATSRSKISSLKQTHSSPFTDIFM